MSDASLIVNGTAYLGWTDISVTRSLEALADTFELSFHEQWTEDKEAIPIDEGDACVLKLLDKTVITGYVDDSEIDYDATTHNMRVAGRSKLGDLVDCAAIHTAGSGSWARATLKKIAVDICTPFGISVVVQTDIGGAFASFKINDGETAYEALERGARMRGVLLLSNRQGGLVIARAGTKRTKTAIRYGVNVLQGGRSGSGRDRFRTYIIKSQAPSGDDFFGPAATGLKRTSTDSAVKRYRPTVVMAESYETGRELQKRADWERNVRSGRARRLQYTVQGWENDEGLWEPNVLVRVVDARLRVDRDLLIMAVRQSKGEGGTVTQLEVADPAAISVEPLTNKPAEESSFL